MSSLGPCAPVYHNAAPTNSAMTTLHGHKCSACCKQALEPENPHLGSKCRRMVPRVARQVRRHSRGRVLDRWGRVGTWGRVASWSSSAGVARGWIVVCVNSRLWSGLQSGPPAMRERVGGRKSLRMGHRGRGAKWLAQKTRKETGATGRCSRLTQGGRAAGTSTSRA